MNQVIVELFLRDMHRHMPVERRLRTGRPLHFLQLRVTGVVARVVGGLPESVPQGSVGEELVVHHTGFLIERPDCLPVFDDDVAGPQVTEHPVDAAGEDHVLTLSKCAEQHLVVVLNSERLLLGAVALGLVPVGVTIGHDVHKLTGLLPSLI